MAGFLRTLKQLEPFLRWLVKERDAGGPVTDIFDPRLRNFVNGLTSPDADQRKRFEKHLESTLPKTTMEEAWNNWEILERGKRRRGRRKGSKDGDLKVLKKMRDLVASGEARSVRDASLKVAKAAHISGTTASLESTAKRLARKYRRMGFN